MFVFESQMDLKYFELMKEEMLFRKWPCLQTLNWTSRAAESKRRVNTRQRVVFHFVH